MQLYFHSFKHSAVLVWRGLGENDLLGQEELSATGRAMNRRIVLEIFFDKIDDQLWVDTEEMDQNLVDDPNREPVDARTSINKSIEKVLSDEEF